MKNGLKFETVKMYLAREKSAFACFFESRMDSIWWGKHWESQTLFHWFKKKNKQFSFYTICVSKRCAIAIKIRWENKTKQKKRQTFLFGFFIFLFSLLFSLSFFLFLLSFFLSFLFCACVVPLKIWKYRLFVQYPIWNEYWHQ